MTKNLSLESYGFVRREDLDYRNDGANFYGYEYNGLPIIYRRSRTNYYFDIKVFRMEDNKFNWYDWVETPEYSLERELYSWEEVDFDKLIDGCNRIHEAVERLNKIAEEEVIDNHELAEIVGKEILDTEKKLDKIKNSRFKWYNASEFDLSSLKRSYDEVVRSIQEAKGFHDILVNGNISNYELRYSRNYYNCYNYIKINPDNYYLKRLFEIIEENK